MKYRAFMCCGMVHGGGTAVYGEWRDLYAMARVDLMEPKFASAYNDSFVGIEVLDPADTKRIIERKEKK